ncbi:hypothetical protein VTH06DRAFT_1307 [Thermothelomyces fergusii]
MKVSILRQRKCCYAIAGTACRDGGVGRRQCCCAIAKPASWALLVLCAFVLFFTSSIFMSASPYLPQLCVDVEGEGKGELAARCVALGEHICGADVSLAI